MEVVIKCAALGLFSATAGLAVRRYQPEISFALSALTCVVILLSCGVVVEKLLDAVKAAEQIFGSFPLQTRPILKCLGIAVTCRFGADLCKDASQSSLASAVELAGGVCAAAVAMPMILSMLTRIGGLL